METRTKHSLPKPIINLPTSITIFRIFLVPVLVVVILTKWERIGVAIFLLAAFTDYLDGYLARKRGEVTAIGKLLDPIADKLLMSAAFISLVEVEAAPAWIVVIVVGRELAVSGLRQVAACQGVAIPASVWGKFKTASQVIAVVLLILGERHLGRFAILGRAALWIVVFLAILSAWDYFRKFTRSLGLLNGSRAT
ncbi:MAG: CDP-diacylglycerol--glycerol-3-phosphate 3-phosphatidyltransferase [Acidobacteria bacterium]|nr:CDP-diacylglycerol--glycerol-3-phosphate 3-phosphatidyltransferase [Acidobacteriota bacterium]